jgi:aspartate kinase
MIVIKIGGSLLTDSTGIEKVINYIIAIRNERPVIVVSAFKGVTDLLIATAKYAARRDTTNLSQDISLIKEKHFKIIKDLIANDKQKKKTTEPVTSLFYELEKTLNTISESGKLSDKSLDYCMSFGEKLSSLILSGILCERNVDSISVYSDKLIITNSDYGSASPIHRLTRQAIKKSALTWKGKVPIITGFIGGTSHGRITTLGRGGSDYSAAIIANHLDAKEIWLVKDVEGVMTADKNIVSDAKVIPKLSYDEAAELSYFGAKVIHPRTIYPLKKKNIHMRIKSIEKVNSPGTVIVRDAHHQNGTKSLSHVIRSSLIKVQGNGLIGVAAIASRIFSTIDKISVDILTISQSFSENSVSFAINEMESEKVLNALREEFKTELKKRKIKRILVRSNISILSVIGKGINSDANIFGKIYNTFYKNGIHVLAFGNGSSDLQTSFIINNHDLHKALNCIHKELNLGV